MSNVLILSKNENFKLDLIDQIIHHAPEFMVCNNTDLQPDILVIDDDFNMLATWQSHRMPIIFLSSTENNLASQGILTLKKPLAVCSFLDALKSANNLFENSEAGYIEFSRYILYPNQKKIVNCQSSQEVKLTEKEVAIIKYLYKNLNNYVMKQDLLKGVWGYADDATTHTVETHIYRLRQKIETTDSQLIETSNGGYKLLTK